MSGEEVGSGWVVKFSKTKPHFEAMRVNNLKKCFKKFRGALELWRLMHSDMSEIFTPWNPSD
jgi:hypothetical protein